MTHPPRRPANPRNAAEALFKPSKTVAAPPTARPAIPGGKELVSIKIDRAVLEYFQQDGPGWQDRINDTLVAAAKGKL